MPQRKLLIDSNVYFRLARDIHPLLFQTFGEEQHCLYVLKELQAEFDNNPRLQRRFPWVDEDSYRRNRRKTLQIGKAEKREIEAIERFMWDTVQTECPGPSPVDVRILAHGYLLGIPVVTDDPDMRKLAGIYGVEVFLSLELLKLMLDCQHVTMTQVEDIMRYWLELRDFPTGFNKDYPRIFGKRPPC